MIASNERRIIISGAGVAGLTAALALASKGFSITLFDKTEYPSEVGAGLQLTPNATRLLDRLGILDRLLPQAVVPDALYLKNSANDTTLFKMMLGKAALTRWQAPYLVCHRADLQTALLSAVKEHPEITLRFGANVVSHYAEQDSIMAQINVGNHREDHHGRLMIGCDGVWSTRWEAAGHKNNVIFTGYTAWRTTLPYDSLPTAFVETLPLLNNISVWVGKNAHFVAYPVRAGSVFNCVAITKGDNKNREWSLKGDVSVLSTQLSGWHRAIHALIDTADQWTYWPLFCIARPRFLMSREVLLLGDSAHAMPPFAAQGAAMAIEDACALAAVLVYNEECWATALSRFNKERLARIARVTHRGTLNRFAYHASSPFAFVRNLLLQLRSTEHFTADLDWLYGYDGTGFMV